MLTNENLKNLSGADLNQRYSHSWIPYQGKIQYCLGFNGDGRVPVIVVRNNNGDTTEGPFRWDALDTERLKSQWYQTKEGLRYFTYMTSKQYSRGYKEDNCYVVAPDQRALNLNGNLIEDCHFGPKFKKRAWKHTVTELEQAVEKKPVQLSDLIVVTPETILFRRTQIGALKNKIFYLFRPEFTQEILEVVDMPHIVNQEAFFRKQPKIDLDMPEMPRPRAAKIARAPLAYDFAVEAEVGLDWGELRPQEERDEVWQVDRHKPTAVMPTEMIKQIVRSKKFGSFIRAELTAESYRTSYIWREHDTLKYRIGFNQ